jgi:hypothetical protein
MKKLMLLMAALLVAGFTYSQTKEEVDLFQAAFGMEKKALVEENIKLDGLQKDAFWTLYDEYEVTRKEYGKKRLELWTEYAKTYKTMTGEQADAWVKKVMDLQVSTDKLMRTYYNKIKKEVNPIVATQFYQIENYIITAIRMEIQEEMPFINEK